MASKGLYCGRILISLKHPIACSGLERWNWSDFFPEKSSFEEHLSDDTVGITATMHDDGSITLVGTIWQGNDKRTLGRRSIHIPADNILGYSYTETINPR